MNKPKNVRELEEKLKPQKVFYRESKCCGNAWFLDYDYMGDGSIRWRIRIKGNKIEIISMKVSGGAWVQSLRFNNTGELLEFMDKHFKEY